MEEKSIRVGIDIMNGSAITSLAMIYALWQSNKQDLLDLIKPFVLYSVGSTTTVGHSIDIDVVCRYLENEFGYKSFQPAVVEKVLNRECSSKRIISEHKIIRKNGMFVLEKSYDEQIEKFSEKRTTCKARSDAVTSALAEYLNSNNVYRRADYTQKDAETKLLSFFERRGSTILVSVDDLHQQMAKTDESDYFVGKFILTQYEQKTVLMDYISELVKGYFVTTALYLQAENPDVTRASFRNVTFFLDTRILLGVLGYKTPQENDSIQEMVKSLQRNGAKLACFLYNEDEIESILGAYKQSTLYRTSRSTYTLEYFDAIGRKSTPVEAAEKHFRTKLREENIISVSPSQILEQENLAGCTEGILNDLSVREIVSKLKPSYKFEGFSDDITAVNTVSRLRAGKKLQYIEKCKAVFVTSNTVLITAVKQYFKEYSIDYGFPIIISGDDLCVLAWLKDFEIDNNLPQMRLLENVMAAITPTRELMDAYLTNLNNLKQQGKIDDDEISLLRVDRFAQKELMELTCGDCDKLTDETIETIRERIKSDSFASGVEHGKNSAEEEYLSKQQAKRNNACRQAEQEVEREYLEKEYKYVKWIRITAAVVAVVFIAASAFSLLFEWNTPIKVALLVVSIISTIQGACPFFNKDNFLIAHTKKWLLRKKIEEIDRRKEKYLSILGSTTET